MTQQTEFPNPPGGHVGLLTWDSVSKKWYAVLGDSGGRLQIEVTTIALPTGAAKESKQLPDGHNVTVDNVSLAVTGTFYQQTQPVSIASEIPAGTKNIGDVDIATMPTVTAQAKDGDKIFSFENIVEQTLYNENLTAGQNVLDGTPVASGKLVKLTAAAIMYTGTAPSGLSIFVQGLCGSLPLLDERTIVSTQWYIWTGEATMQVDDFIRGVVDGATSTDDLYFRYTGLQMNAP